MAQQEKYNLTWHTYTDHLSEMMKSLVTDNAFADVTLVSDDKKYVKAHKNILSFCSPTFKEIFTLDKSASVIYLKGVNHSELESILQFIYLGEASFSPDRMNAFFSAGKSLAIKELSKDFESDDVPTSQDDLLVAEEELIQNQDHCQSVQSQEQNVEQNDNMGHKKCDQCDKVFATDRGLSFHVKSIHEGVRYNCSKCEYQGTTKPNLYAHIRSKHEKQSYNCKQCDYKSNWQNRLKEHIETIHEGVKYKCNQCNDGYEYSQKSGLKQHIENVHEGLKYQCNQCDYQCSQKCNLYKHVRARHDKF